MRVQHVLLIVVLSLCAPARAQGIVEVLERSQAVRLAAFAPARADSPEAAALRASFDRLSAAHGGQPLPDLQVVSGPLFAECVQGRSIVAGEALGRLGEGERLFVLAHELAHALLGHWDQLAALYQRHIPGAVVPATTDPVAGVLGREASALAHAQELAADAFAWNVIRESGYGLDTARAVFMLNGMQQDTATHPGTRKRFAHLRSLP